MATLESTPENATHWCRTKMAERSGLSQSTVGRIWRAFGLKPHRADTFKLSTDPFFVEKVRDVVGLYLSPPEAGHRAVRGREAAGPGPGPRQPVLPMARPGRARDPRLRPPGRTAPPPCSPRWTSRRQRHPQLHRQHRAVEFRKFLVAIDKGVPADLDVHLICDNLATHKTPAIGDWLARPPPLPSALHPTGSVDEPSRTLVRAPHRPARSGLDAATASPQLERDIRVLDRANGTPDPELIVWTRIRR